MVKVIVEITEGKSMSGKIHLIGREYKSSTENEKEIAKIVADCIEAVNPYIPILFASIKGGKK